MSEPVKSERIRESRILVIDDHRNIRVSLQLTLSAEGAHVDDADSVQTAMRKLGPLDDKSITFPYDVVFLDIRLPDGSGLDILKKLSLAGLASRVIMISGEGTVRDAFEATQMGAFDYIEKPFHTERILVSTDRCLELHNIRRANAVLKSQVMRGQEILGQHDSVDELRRLITRVAPTNSRVLILGESGTGKELIAKAIHRESNRAHKPLIKVNCAAIPQSLVESELFGHTKGAFTGAIKARKGLFEQAHQGTLFLDEIGELDLNVQAKLLRVLQNGDITPIGDEKTVNVDVRLITATHRDLETMVQEGTFREDLYYRLNTLPIHSPPLRERGEDVVLLAQHFLDEACEEHALGQRTLSPLALQQIREYHWPGNIRELKNIVERLAILSETQEIDAIPDLAAKSRSRGATTPQTPSKGSESKGSPPSSSAAPFNFECGVLPWHDLHQSFERDYLKYVLHKAGGNVSEAARLLCLERAYLHRLMKKLGIQREVVVTEDS